MLYLTWLIDIWVSWCSAKSNIPSCFAGGVFKGIFCEVIVLWLQVELHIVVTYV